MKFSIDEYPMIVQTDGRKSRKAFEIFDMLVDAFLRIGLSEGDAFFAAIVFYDAAAAPLRERNWRNEPKE